MLKDTQYTFPGQTGVYRGKVRDTYTVGNLFISIATDRISAFDHILPKPIPYKGQVLNQIAAHFMRACETLVPNWLLDTPDPNVTIGYKARPIKLEVVVRGYLAGHAWRVYKAGGRALCGVTMPDGMREGERFSNPIITPATKAEEGHDEDISEEALLDQKIVKRDEWKQLKRFALALFYQGTKMARDRGLILVDTKYEFGKYKDEIMLIDEIHTPDSSRYYVQEGYRERLESGEQQVQLSKEFVREWLMSQGFQGLEGQTMPEMPDSFIDSVSHKYIDLYEKLTSRNFVKNPYDNIEDRIYNNVINFLKRHV